MLSFFSRVPNLRTSLTAPTMPGFYVLSGGRQSRAGGLLAGLYEAILHNKRQALFKSACLSWSLPDCPVMCGLFLRGLAHCGLFSPSDTASVSGTAWKLISADPAGGSIRIVSGDVSVNFVTLPSSMSI
jgi:hypothetical protein